MVDVRNAYPQLQQAGGEVVVVTMGTVQQVNDFRTRHQLTFPCLADPGRQAYRAYGLERGSLSQVAGPGIWAKGLKSLLRGGAGVPVGDPLQMPGVFVVDPQAIVRYAHYPANSADVPDPQQLLEVLKSIRSAP